MKVWEVKLIVDAIVDGPLNYFILFLIPVSMSIPCIKQKDQFTVFKYPDDILNIFNTLNTETDCHKYTHTYCIKEIK